MVPVKPLLRMALGSRSVFEHGVVDVASASGEADEGGVVLLTFGAFSVVIGAAGRVVQRRERGQEQGAFEFAVA